MRQLLDEFMLSKFDTEIGQVPLGALDDSGIIDDLVITIDGHTVKPLFFPGGDIGSLAVAGTINDIAVMGARPVALALGIVMEEGLDLEIVGRVADSIASEAKKAGVPIMTGDTKVVEKGAIDQMVVTTAAIGVRSEMLETNFKIVKKYRQTDERWIRDSSLRDGDAIIVSGSLGDHGIAVLSCREGYGFESDFGSDVASLNKMIDGALKIGGIVSMKDPTRGGLANTLNEWAEKSGIGIIVEETSIPVNPGVNAACGMLGLDHLEIGNEGKVVIGIVPDMAEAVLNYLKGTPEGKDAAIIGTASAEVNRVLMNTKVGGRRIVEAPVGDPVPRIC